MKTEKSVRKIALTHSIKHGIFVPIMNSTTPSEMLRMAESLETAAKALRQSASMLQQFATSSAFPSAMPQVVTTAPTVKDAIVRALQDAGKPLHVVEIYESVKRQGARIKNRENVSSILSKDGGKTFRITPQRHGYWELVTPQTNLAGA